MFIVMVLFSLSLVTRDTSNEPGLLLEVKNHVNDSLATLKSWNASTGVCNWSGVTCSSGLVVGLQLTSLSLPDSLLANIIQGLRHLRALHITKSKLKNDESQSFIVETCPLEVLELSNNQIDGGLVFSELLLICKRLKLLNLSSNGLEGEFGKVQVGNSLETLDLSGNKLAGEVPNIFFSTCKRLHYVDLSSNRLSGRVPQNLFTNCRALRSVKLTSNSLSAMVIPACFKLAELDVSFNMLSGELVIQRPCHFMKLLNISNNLLSGSSLASNVANLFPSLEKLDASFNNLSGKVPTTPANLTYLDLSSNSLTTTSSSACSPDAASKLEILLLTNNKLTGDQVVNASIIHCRDLKVLDVSFNQLGGEIPQNICSKAPKLRHLLAWGNNLQGHLPSSLGLCTNLSVILLGYNNLTGHIPSEVSHLSKLQWLGLNDNRLTGTIPSFENAEELLVLQLANNSLEGELPARLDMQVMELRGNALSGKIPPTLGFMKQKTIRTNFIGSLRSVIFTVGSACMNTGTFLVQGMRLEDLERHLSMKTGCQNLHLGFVPGSRYIYVISSPVLVDLSHNNLQGEIPPQLGELKDLQRLTLAYNSLVGVIPANLGNARSLASIDLSHNDLQGTIPSSLSLLTYMVAFDVSWNNLSGPIPQTAQFTTFKVSSFEGNPGLCGPPVNTTCRSNTQLMDQPVPSHDPVPVIAFTAALVTSFITCSMLSFTLCHNRYLKLIQ